MVRYRALVATMSHRISRGSLSLSPRDGGCAFKLLCGYFAFRRELQLEIIRTGSCVENGKTETQTFLGDGLHN